MILNLDADLVILTSFEMSPTLRSPREHGLSGHIFECLDYYYLLSKYMKVKVIIPELVSTETFDSFVEGHYSIKFDKSDFIFINYFDLLKCKKILIVDGGFWFIQKYRNRFCGKIFVFACGADPINADYSILADFKVYNQRYPNMIDYTKKILPNLKRIPGDRPFAHITKNCKSLNSDQIGRLLNKYPDLLAYSDAKNITENEKYKNNFTNKQIRNFSFSKFIYTPVLRHFDCSPRLIIECQILQIPFDLFEIDYYDPGLQRRLEYPYTDFILSENDSIIDILKP